jgi:hypothetical protein
MRCDSQDLTFHFESTHKGGRWNKDVHGLRGIGLFLVRHRFDAEAAAKEEPVSPGNVVRKGAIR